MIWRAISGFLALTLTLVIPARLHADAPYDFVTVAGTHFKASGRPFFFQGTNIYEAGLLNGSSEEDVARTMRNLRWKGIKVVRMWGYCNGYWPHTSPLQWSPLNFNQEALRRVDWALAKAAENDIKIIFVFGNFENEYGGIQWWVDKKLGGGEKERFFTDYGIRSDYKEYMKFFIYRRNSVNGRIYKDDPTIMAWEMLNEPHTSDNYERDRGMKPGKIVYDWLWEMSHFIKQHDPYHLVATGEEGYRSDTWSDRYNWLNDGHKGADFAANIKIPTIDFVTLHIYPDKWQIPYHDRAWVKDYFLNDRLRLANQVYKPVVLEEYGFQRWYGNRDFLLREIHSYVNSWGIPGTMVWRISDGSVDDWSYEFDFGDSGFYAIQDQANYMNGR